MIRTKMAAGTLLAVAAAQYPEKVKGLKKQWYARVEQFRQARKQK